MSSMFDFNDDGHVDTGEQYIGYQIFKDVTDSSSGAKCSRGRLDGFTIFMIILIGYAVLNTICGWLY